MKIVSLVIAIKDLLLLYILKFAKPIERRNSISAHNFRCKQLIYWLFNNVRIKRYKNETMRRKIRRYNQIAKLSIGKRQNGREN